MSITIFYGVKGGQGCSTTALAYALQLDGNVTIWDATGTGDVASIAGLLKATVEDDPYRTIRPGLTVVTDSETVEGIDRRDGQDHLVIDAGTTHWRNDKQWRWWLHPDRQILVTRACYLAINRALLATQRPDVIVLLSEPGRILTGVDVEAVLKAPVWQIRTTPAAAGAIDAGLFVNGRNRREYRVMEAA